MDSVVLIEKLSKFGKVGNKDILKNIPEDYRRYKCHKCFFIVDSDPCPNCGETLLEVACPLDHCDCHDEIISGIKYCPVCGDAICPECGTHDVVQISRVTGYLSEVSGWVNSKRQELKDRHRYDVAPPEVS